MQRKQTTKTQCGHKNNKNANDPKQNQTALSDDVQATFPSTTTKKTLKTPKTQYQRCSNSNSNDQRTTVKNNNNNIKMQTKNTQNYHC
jgi:hypothetical protein